MVSFKCLFVVAKKMVGHILVTQTSSTLYGQPLMPVSPSAA